MLNLRSSHQNCPPGQDQWPGSKCGQKEESERQQHQRSQKKAPGWYGHSSIRQAGVGPDSFTRHVWQRPAQHGTRWFSSEFQRFSHTGLQVSFEVYCAGSSQDQQSRSKYKPNWWNQGTASAYEMSKAKSRNDQTKPLTYWPKGPSVFSAIARQELGMGTR